MSAKSLCQTYLKKSLEKKIHLKRAQCLFDVSWSLVSGSNLSLTALGRGMDGPGYVKHKIKKVDRLLGNPNLRRELPHIYKALTEPVLACLSHIVIAVDWSGYDGHAHHVLRASVLYQGRSIPIYNQVFPQAQLGTKASHEHFLDGLEYILPKGKPVIVVTDAGFGTPWFESVSRRHWHFVGRGKLDTKHQHSVTGIWHELYEYESDATHRPTYQGHGLLGKRTNTPVYASVITYKAKSKQRKGQSRYPDVNAGHAKQTTQAWVIVTNLDGVEVAKKAVNLYKKRMQIEQNFRDDKSFRYGFGWRLARVIKKQRIASFCLIATIATFFLWWVGFTSEQRGLQKYFQANTVHKKRVVSFITLAKQVLKSRIPLKKSQLYEAAKHFIRQYNKELADFV